MKLFLDTADLQQIKKWRASGLIDGVTTNPTHLSVQGGDSLELIKHICATMDPFDVSVEITQKDPHDVYEQAMKISRIASNVVVKVPCLQDYIFTIRQLVVEGINVIVTLIFSLTQALAMAKLGVTYISPFVGRLDDIDCDGIQLLHDCRDMLETYGYKTKLLAASLRHMRHLHDAIQSGADIATVPPTLLEQMLEHPLTSLGVEKFDRDWEKLGIKQFP